MLFRQISPIKFQFLRRFSLLTRLESFMPIVKKPFSQNNKLLSKKNRIKMSVTYLDTPDKAEFDKKEYRVLRLPNSLLVLLVSDPSPVPVDSDSSGSESETEEENRSEEEWQSVESTSTENETEESDDSEDEGDEKLAACAMMIDVGSFSDPPNINGLAHFLEHMIFMGSKKFPQENEFDAYIKKCGGFDNADTECEETSFYFEISEEHLDGAMDRFSALFVHPLMKKGAMQRERDAVESEFVSTLQDDEMRRDQLLAALATPGHPSGVFAWGNSKTLKDAVDDEELYKCLHEFRKRHYSAHRMYFCVQARLGLDELEKMVVKHFSKIPNNNLNPDDFSEYNYKNAFMECFYDQVYFVKPVSNMCKLELTWCLPPLFKQYKSKPHHYLAYLLGYEGPGSLCAYLRRKLWALEMVAGIDDSGFEYNSLYSLFNLCIYLTEEGFNHLNEVLAATYAYIKLFQKCGPSKELFTELQEIEGTTFRFHTERSALDNVEDLVVNMKYYPPKDILTGPELYFTYDEKAIWEIIRILNTPNFNIMITSTKKFDGIVYDKKEKWFGTEYTYIPTPKEWILLWENAKPIPELFFPEPNVFIARDFRILFKEEDRPNMPQYPKKIVGTDVCELWFRQDDKFLLPLAYMYFYFITPLPMVSEKNAVLMSLYSLVVKYQLVEQLYPASVAGLDYQLYSSDKGLVLKVNGYNEKLHLIVDIITKHMTILLESLNEKQLKVFVRQQQRNLFNSLIKPKSLNKDIRLCIVENVRWSMHDKYNLLKDITLSDLKDFANSLFREMKIQALIQGNLKEEIAHNVMNTILKNFNCSKIKKPELIQSRSCQLPVGSNYILCKSFNDKDVNTVVSNLYQIGPSTLRNECIMDLLMMLVEEPLFDILRTKEQLGYDVSSSVRNNHGILGYTITVNSQENKFDASHVELRIEAFRTHMMQILQDMRIEEYEQFRESLIKIKQVVDNELKDEVIRNWGEITCEEYIFDRTKKEVECLRNITKENVIDFCINEEKNIRKLSIQVIGNKVAKESPDEDPNEIATTFHLKYVNEGSQTIDNIANFKKGLFVYPVTKTLIDCPLIENLQDNQ